MILSINPQNPQQRLISKVSEVLDRGGLIAYPTDTFYGIGCDLFNKKGIQLIYKLKNRPLKKPFSFICDNLKEISRYAQVSNYAYKTMKKFLPGPYTFILEGTKLVPKIMLTKRKTVGIRVPNNKICRAINGKDHDPSLYVIKYPFVNRINHIKKWGYCELFVNLWIVLLNVQGFIRSAEGGITFPPGYRKKKP